MSLCKLLMSHAWQRQQHTCVAYLRHFGMSDGCRCTAAAHLASLCTAHMAQSSPDTSLQLQQDQLREQPDAAAQQQAAAEHAQSAWLACDVALLNGAPQELMHPILQAAAPWSHLCARAGAAIS